MPTYSHSMTYLSSDWLLWPMELPHLLQHCNGTYCTADSNWMEEAWEVPHFSPLHCSLPCSPYLLPSLIYYLPISLPLYSPRSPCFCPPASVSMCICIHLNVCMCVCIYIYVCLSPYLPIHPINIVSDRSISYSFAQITFNLLLPLTHCRQARQVQRLLSQVCRS